MNLRISLCSILLICAWSFCFAQHNQNFTIDTIDYLKKTDYTTVLQELKQEFGLNKEFPTDLEIACLTALSFYPELVKTNIHFNFKEKLKPTMRSIPCIRSLMRNRTKRVYFIQMQKEKIKNLSFNALVGVLGHELAHVLQSYQKSSFVSARLGFAWQFNKKKRAVIERMADRITINHGLGYALLEKRLDSHRQAKNPTQLEYIKRIYLNPREILLGIEKNSTIISKYEEP